MVADEARWRTEPTAPPPLDRPAWVKRPARSKPDDGCSGRAVPLAGASAVASMSGVSDAGRGLLPGGEGAKRSMSGADCSRTTGTGTGAGTSVRLCEIAWAWGRGRHGGSRRGRSSPRRLPRRSPTSTLGSEVPPPPPLPPPPPTSAAAGRRRRRRRRRGPGCLSPVVAAAAPIAAAAASACEKKASTAAWTSPRCARRSCRSSLSLGASPTIPRSPSPPRPPPPTPRATAHEAPAARRLARRTLAPMAQAPRRSRPHSRPLRRPLSSHDPCAVRRRHRRVVVDGRRRWRDRRGRRRRRPPSDLVPDRLRPRVGDETRLREERQLDRLRPSRRRR